ncbi:GTP pyrophosphokinase [Paenibacillus protaetiae]|uniref:GTP pyrophosphokinase family protein n=1 Tax=Paenibacillus protaetiae TaxID=2509456 RepID=A0A4V0YFQ3_9BACL|nr:GTP pyrophosphokinase family protein [Paenibacillus protaetiae]QAY68511.1 GTP pyrophosphokinase family protein [Paenibacillus protaetiae]
MDSNYLDHFRKMKHDLTRFMMLYKFALKELETKIEILKEEFQLLHEYNPIEHTSARVKAPESILNKLYRKNCELSFESIQKNVRDIAGMRITCSFVSDIYRLRDMLSSQADLTVLEEKDYIQRPKENGYRSLHLIVEVPVFMSDSQETVCVEVQIRTIAMDFWASLEHKIFYKYDKAVPVGLVEELKEAADSAAALDRKMERLHKEVAEIKGSQPDELEEMVKQIIGAGKSLKLPSHLIGMLEGVAGPQN